MRDVRGGSRKLVRIENVARTLGRRIQIGEGGEVFCELDFFVSDLRHLRQRAFKIFLQRIAHGVELDADLFDSVVCRCPRKAARHQRRSQTSDKLSPIHWSSQNTQNMYGQPPSPVRCEQEILLATLRTGSVFTLFLRPPALPPHSSKLKAPPGPQLPPPNSGPRFFPQKFLNNPH